MIWSYAPNWSIIYDRKTLILQAIANDIQSSLFATFVNLKRWIVMAAVWRLKVQSFFLYLNATAHKCTLNERCLNTEDMELLLKGKAQYVWPPD